MTPDPAAALPSAFEAPVADTPSTLLDVLDRLLDRGVVATGDLVVSVAGVDLLAVGFDVLLASVDRAASYRGGLARLPQPTPGEDPAP